MRLRRDEIVYMNFEIPKTLRNRLMFIKIHEDKRNYVEVLEHLITLYEKQEAQHPETRMFHLPRRSL